jgi:hypothetical protein
MEVIKPQLFVHYEEPSVYKIKPIVNGWTCKPRIGGLWTSTYCSSGSCWTDTAIRIQHQRNPLELNWYLLFPHENANLFEVDCVEDCKRLFNVYGLPNIDFPQDLALMVLDFERMQRDYDGLHLTRKGEFETSNRTKFPNLFGWDCESIFWFHWMFREPQQIADNYDRIQQEKEAQKKQKNRH